MPRSGAVHCSWRRIDMRGVKSAHGSTRKTGERQYRFSRWEAIPGPRAIAHGRSCQSDRGIRQRVQAIPGGFKETLPLVTATSVGADELGTISITVVWQAGLAHASACGSWHGPVSIPPKRGRALFAGTLRRVFALARGTTL